VRNLCIIGYLVLFCVAGCESSPPAAVRTTPPLSTPDGMIEYLQKLNLPVLKSVEKWPDSVGPGIKLTTAHYEIYTTLMEPLMLSQVPGFMESAYRGYQAQLPQTIETTQSFTVYLFADRQQWEDFTRAFAGSQAPMYLRLKAGAYCLNGACVTYNVGRERTFSALGHEGWHQFTKQHFVYRLPSWLDEGVAMMFETSSYEAGLFRFRPEQNGYRLGGLRKSLIENKTIPLEALVSMNPGEAIMDSDDAVQAFYSQSYALVRFLREEDYGRRLTNYQQMMLDGLLGRWELSDAGKRVARDRNIPLTVPWNRAMGTLLFKQYVDGDFAKIESEYLAFCRKIVYHVRLQ